LVIGPILLTELLIVAGRIYDWRTRGRPHPVWLIDAAITTAVILLRGPLSGTLGWVSFPDALAHIPGWRRPSSMSCDSFVNANG
jgi:hypothetical protein